ncbi:MAG: dTMP kinase [Thermoplasmata archaeon]
MNARSMAVARRSPRRALYVAFEGLDGAGKSTLVPLVARRLRRAGYSVRVRREPGSLELKRYAQALGAVDPWAGAIYFTIDRYLQRPALERDLTRADVVLGDRSFWSTIAYQGSALPARQRRRLKELQRRATIPPELIVLLEIPVPDALARVGRRRQGRSPLERRRTLNRVAAAYDRLAEEGRWIRVDGRRRATESADRVVATLPAGLARRRRARS